MSESFEVLWTIGVAAKVLFGGSEKRSAQMEEGARETLARLKSAFE